MANISLGKAGSKVRGCSINGKVELSQAENSVTVTRSDAATVKVRDAVSAVRALARRSKVNLVAQDPGNGDTQLNMVTFERPTGGSGAGEASAKFVLFGGKDTVRLEVIKKCANELRDTATSSGFAVEDAIGYESIIVIGKRGVDFETEDEQTLLAILEVRAGDWLDPDDPQVDANLKEKLT